MDGKIYLLFRYARRQQRIYRDWPDQCSLTCESVDDPLPTWKIPDDAALIVTHVHYRWEELSVLRKAFEENRVPILILADGVLEYRNTWQHEGLPKGSMFQPVFGHKLACIGAGQARLIESWGNAGRCEVVGFPPLDSVSPLPPRTVDPNDSGNPFRVLVATANTPAFDESQRLLLTHSLKWLKAWTENNRLKSGREIKVDWRISPDLAEALGFELDDNETRPPLAQAIGNVDAVITTPSTLYLESLLYGRPTAILDFHNTPPYVPSAWTIGAESQIQQVLNELADPPFPKLQFQSFILDEQLQHREPAGARLVQLIDAMVSIGQEAKASGQPLAFPAQILPPPQAGLAAPLTLANYFPDCHAFQIEQVQRLQIELSAAEERLKELPTQLGEKENRIAELMAKNEGLNRRIQSLHDRVVALRKRLGIVDNRDLNAGDLTADNPQVSDANEELT